MRGGYVVRELGNVINEGGVWVLSPLFAGISGALLISHEILADQPDERCSGV